MMGEWCLNCGKQLPCRGSVKQSYAIQANDYSEGMLKNLLERLVNEGWETQAVIQEGRHAGLILMEREAER